MGGLQNRVGGYDMKKKKRKINESKRSNPKPKKPKSNKPREIEITETIPGQVRGYVWICIQQSHETSCRWASAQ